MTVLIIGGAGSGKSALAERTAVRLAAGGERIYLATMLPADAEDRARIARHRAARGGLGFHTVERGRDLAGLPAGALPPGSTLLLDSVTALLTNEMFPPGPDFRPDDTAPARCAAHLLALAARTRHAVYVSDDIFSDAAAYDDVTEGFRRGLALIHRSLAPAFDTVVEVCAGLPVLHKGVLP